MVLSSRTAGLIFVFSVALACSVRPVEDVDAAPGQGGSGPGGSSAGIGGGSAGTGGATGIGGAGGIAGSASPGGGGGSGGTMDAGMTSDARNCTVGIITDSICSFSGTQGEHGWTYGYIEPAGDNTFHPMAEFDEANKVWWAKEAEYWTKVTEKTAHPNGTTTSGGRKAVVQQAVRRWTSSVSGTIMIQINVYKYDNTTGQNGVVASVVVDGVEVWSKMLASDDGVGLRGDLMSADVNVGSTVDLVVDPFEGDDKNDETHFSVTITQ